MTTGCPHCMALSREMGEIRVIVERIDKAVNGNGQAGLEQRTSSLERWRSRITGVLAVVGALAATATTIGAAVLGGWIKRP